MGEFSFGYAAERMVVIIAFLLIGVASSWPERLSGSRRASAAPLAATVGSGSVLDRVILDWLLPITILYNISGISWSVRALYVVVLCCAVTAIDAALVLLACYLFNIEGVVRQTLLIVVPLGNTAYFGLAAVGALLGNKFLPNAIIFDQVGTTVMLATYGNYVAGTPGNRLGKEEFLVLLRFRPLWGFVLGIVLDLIGVHLLLGATRVLGAAITAALLPVAMIALGIKLSNKGLVLNSPVVLGVVIRVVIGPALVIGFISLATNARSTLAGGLIQTAMPSMIAAAFLAERRGLSADVAYSLCAVGIVVACCVLPFIAWFLVR